MLTFLFWNVRKEGKSYRANSRSAHSPARTSRIIEAIAQLSRLHDVDILMFAELEAPSADVLTALLATTTHDYNEVESDQCTKIRIFTRFDDRYALSIPGAGDARYTVRHIILPSRTPFLLAVAHFPDKSHRSTDRSRNSYCNEVASNLLSAERNCGHQKTILVGDLNMNPYEAGITGELKATMTRSLALKGKDHDSGIDKRFYNPMWQHFGEVNNTPAGTYYWAGSADELYWNIYDQVLLRPALLAHFTDRNLQVLVSAGDISLLTREGVPRKLAVSDHLPILFRVDL